MEDQIRKKADKTKKKGKKEVIIYGDNQEKNENNNENAVQNDEEEVDFVIQGKIIDANVNNNNNNNTIVKDQTWVEDTNTIQYNPSEPKPEEPKKKKIGWGDNIKSTTITSANVNAGDLYFPDLNDKNAEQKKTKERKELFS